jgi:DNA-binding NtrC family response regulator
MMSDGTHVLVADEGLVGHRLADSLAPSQVTVVMVTDGLQALRALHTRHVDAVITEHHLRYFDGLDLLGQCHLVWPELPVILLSDRLVDVVGPARAKGVYACLPKPIDIGALIEVLSEALTRPRTPVGTTRSI